MALSDDQVRYLATAACVMVAFICLAAMVIWGTWTDDSDT